MRLLANTFKEDFNLFLKNYALWICIGIAVLIAATIIIIFFIKNRKNNVTKEDEPSLPDDEWLNALGGKENISEVSGIGSRLSVTLVNKELIDREKLTLLGVSNIMMMSSKATLIIEDKAEKMADKINKLLK